MQMALILLLFLVTVASSLDFVVYITLIGSSHLNFLNSLTDQLMARGHNVDVVVGILNSGVKTEGKIHGRRITTFGFPGDSPWITTTHLANPFETTIIADKSHFYESCWKLAKIGMETEIPVAAMLNDSYDAALVTDYDFAGYIYARQAGQRKVMSFTSVGILTIESDILGLPSPASIPDCNLDAFFGDLSIISKIRRFFHLGNLKLNVFPIYEERFTQLARKHYGQEFPSAGYLARRCDIVFINANEFVEHPRIISQKVKYIGGIGRREPKPLTEEFKGILQTARKGVIAVAFGTMAPSEKMPRRIKEAMVNGFKKFPDYTFIWKYTPQESDWDLFKDAKNIVTVDWIPQNDLLHDKKVVGFVTHCGLNSLMELVHAGVPAIAIPLVSDQLHNGRNVERLGIGVNLNKQTLSAADIISGLEKILLDPKYKTQSAHLAKMLADHPDEAKKTFVKWAEFGAKHESIHKQYNLMESDMSIFTYYCADVILFLLALVLLAVQLVRIVVRKLLSLVSKKEKQE